MKKYQYTVVRLRYNVTTHSLWSQKSCIAYNAGNAQTY